METETATQDATPALDPAPAPSEPPKFRLIAREARRFDFPLTVEERARIGDRVGDLGRELRALERKHDAETEAAKARIAAAKSEAAEEAAKRREKIQEAADLFDDALSAQTTGVERRSVEIERRALVATSTIEIVRLDTGEVVESRPMTEAEQAKWCRQGTIEDVTGGATVKAGAIEGEAEAPAEDAEGEEAAAAPPEESDALDEGEAEARGLPVGWPRSWRAKEWTVKGLALTEGDVHEVYLRLSSTGTTLDELLAGGPGWSGLTWLDRPRVGRAVALLARKGLAQKMVIEGQPPAWASIDPRAVEPEEEPEPGRADPLPEAADAPKPKRQGKAQTKADRLVNAAAEQSDGWAL